MPPLDLSTPGRDSLRRLLSERNQHPDRAGRIDGEIRSRFERQVAFLCLDMSGFSRLTAKYGVIHFLAMVEQMEAAARPAVTGNRGHVLKQEADNLFAIFETVDDALASAQDILRAFKAMNAVLPTHRDIHGCIGIGFGPALLVGGHDAFGDEVNRACKLGEDLAKRGEILLTEAARKAVTSAAAATFAPARFKIGGKPVRAYRLKPKKR